jgi:hypothetical protein
VKTNVALPVTATSVPYTDTQSGKSFFRVTEKGTTGLIDDFNTDQTKYFVFHKTLPIGTYLRIDNPGKKQTILAEVAGTLNSSSTHMLLMTSRCAQSLMIKGAGEMVEVRYVVPQ